MLSNINPQEAQNLLRVLAEYVAREILQGKETSLLPLTLTVDELTDLTGYKNQKGQIQWLKNRNWHFELAASGRPKVDRTYYLMKMGVDSSFIQRTEKPKSPGPNWAALHEMEAKRQREREERAARKAAKLKSGG